MDQQQLHAAIKQIAHDYSVQRGQMYATTNVLFALLHCMAHVPALEQEIEQGLERGYSKMLSESPDELAVRAYGEQADLIRLAIGEAKRRAASRGDMADV